MRTASPLSSSSAPSPSERLRWAALALFCGLLLLSGALYNGFPLVQSDTGTYLASALSLDVPLDRPVFYGLFVRGTSALGLGLWGAVVVQAALLTGLLLSLMRLSRPRLDERRAAAVVLFTAAATGLPWICGQLMTEAFTGCLALSLYLLAFHGPDLRRWQRAALAAVFTLSLLMHTSHFPIAAIVLALLSLSDRVRPSLLVPAGALAVALAIVPAVNKKLDGRAYFSRSGHVFIMDRLVESRILDRLLQEHCREKNYALCPYRETLKGMGGEDYLWSETPLWKIGGWEYSAAVTWPMIIDAAVYYPLENAWSVAANFMRQFSSLVTNDGLASYGDKSYVWHVVNDSYQASARAFLASRQEAGALPAMAARLSQLHRVIAVAALAAAGFFLVQRKLRLTLGARGLVGFMLMFCAANAFVCGAIEVSPRYQARVVWLLVFAVAMTAVEWAWPGPRIQVEENGPGVRRRSIMLALGAVMAAALAAAVAAVQISRNYPTTAATPYVETPVVVWPRTEKMTRDIPLGTLKDEAGLRVGVQLLSRLKSGREFIGTVIAIGKDTMTVEYSWEFVRWSRNGTAAEPGMAPKR